MVVVGDILPKECAFTVRKTDTCPSTTEAVTVEQVFGGKRSVIFAVPGAFTPTCSEKHLPGFVALADELKAAGAEVIACVSGKQRRTAPNLLIIVIQIVAPSS
jgi:peroxiredoxin